jgi:serine/threonine protein kinase
VDLGGDVAELLDVAKTPLSPREYLRSLGTVFTEFGAATQDSGNVSFGVEAAGVRYFVKTAGAPGAAAHLGHDARVALLHNAAELAESCTHPALPAFHGVIESAHGPMLVYAWAPGELLHVPADRRDDPGCAYQRFRALPPSELTAALAAFYDLNVALERAGWVAGDLYDGSLIYDFEGGVLHAIDLDSYHRGPLVNEVGRMFGSTRFMAPEEFERGASIDWRTTVFNLGRFAAVFLSDGTLDATPFRGTPAQLETMRRACAPLAEDRYASVSAFAAAWEAAA